MRRIRELFFRSPMDIKYMKKSAQDFGFEKLGWPTIFNQKS